jgi:hypothetical protein
MELFLQILLGLVQRLHTHLGIAEVEVHVLVETPVPQQLGIGGHMALLLSLEFGDPDLPCILLRP